jgi:heme-degrading monooxygenase HmoA
MLCALTVRTLKPGTFEEFREAFMRDLDGDDPPPGWVRFNMIRNTQNPDEVVCFGFFDGTLEDLRRETADQSRDAQRDAIAPFVESVGADGLFEVVEEFSVAPRSAA